MTGTFGGTYATGTLTLTNGSDHAAFSGTLMSTEAEVGDFIYVNSLNLLIYVNDVTSDTSLGITPAWSGTTQTAIAYTLLKNSPLRYDPAITQAKTRDLLTFYEGIGFFYFVTGASPDPGVGIDGQWALKVNAGLPWSLWYHTGGVWVLQSATLSLSGVTHFTDTTEATGVATTYGARFEGGVEIAKKLFVAGAVALASTLGVVGTASFADGAVGTPSISFTSDSDTGIYRVGANDLGIAVGGSKILDIGVQGMSITPAAALTSAQNALNITAIAPTGATVNGTLISITGAGTVGPQFAMRVGLNAGYTGPQNCAGLVATNASSGTGTTLIPAAGSNSVLLNLASQFNATGSHTGINVGNNGLATGADTNVGGLFLAQIAKTGAGNKYNIGLVASAYNTVTGGSTPIQIGAFISLNKTAIPAASAALHVDNGSSTDIIARFSDNGVDVVTIADGGAVNFTGTTAFFANGSLVNAISIIDTGTSGQTFLLGPRIGTGSAQTLCLYASTASGLLQSWNGTTLATTIYGALSLSSNLGITGGVTVSNTTDSASTITGSVVLSGGIGVAKNVVVGGLIVGQTTTDVTGASSGSIISSGGIYATKRIVSGTEIFTGSTSFAYGVNGIYSVAASNGISYMFWGNITNGERARMAITDSRTFTFSVDNGVTAHLTIGSSTSTFSTGLTVGGNTILNGTFGGSTVVPVANGGTGVTTVAGLQGLTKDGLINSAPVTVDFSITGIDFAISLPLPTGMTRFMPFRLNMYNASASLAGATFAVWSNTGGTGGILLASTATTITASADATAANSSSTGMVQTITYIGASLPTANTVYFRIGTTAAATAKIIMSYFPLS